MQIEIKWSTRNVIETARIMGVEITTKEADGILLSIKRQHAKNRGIYWNHMQWGIEDLVKGREESEDGK